MERFKLLEVGVGIWFDTDGILNLDKDGELRLSIFSALAQNESAKKSESVKFGLHEAIKKGTVFGFDNMFGYRKKDGKLMIDEKEAPAMQEQANSSWICAGRVAGLKKLPPKNRILREASLPAASL